MATTAIGLRYPVTSDNNAVATDLQNLASDIDPILEGSYTQAEITAFTAGQKWEHRRVWNSTRGAYQFYDVGTTSWIDEAVVALNSQVASYTLVLADAFAKVIKLNNASAMNLNVPTNASVAFPIGTLIGGFQYGAGQVTVVAVTPGTTSIRTPAGATKSRTQYSSFSLLKIATDEWLLSGDIVT